MADLPKTFRPPHARSTQERKRDHDTRRRRNQPWRAWYKSKAWQSRRAVQLMEHPLCRRCEERGRIVEASVVNHVDGHNGDFERFYFGEVESLCKPCHDIDVQREEAAGRKAHAEANRSNQ